MSRPAASNVALFLIPTFIWGTTWLAIKFQLGTVSPEVSVVWRFALAAAIILGWCALRGVSLRFGLRDHVGFALLGALLFGVNYVFTYRSELYLTSGLVAVLFASLVFWNLLGARLFFGTEPPRAVVAGATLGVAGVAFLFWPEVASLRAGASATQIVGMGLAVLATVLASGGNLLSQRLFARGIPVLPATGLSMGYAAALLALWCALTGVGFTFDARPGYVLSLLYLALFGSVVAFLTFLTLVHRIGAGRSGYSAAVTPAIAMGVSTAFEGYQWTPGTLSGMGLVLAGTVLVLRAKATARAT